MTVALCNNEKCGCSFHELVAMKIFKVPNGTSGRSLPLVKT